jgi:hypothetical protein
MTPLETRLTRLALDMRTCAAMLAQVPGMAPKHHAQQLLGAAEIAEGWIPEIRAICGQQGQQSCAPN